MHTLYKVGGSENINVIPCLKLILYELNLIILKSTNKEMFITDMYHFDNLKDFAATY